MALKRSGCDHVGPYEPSMTPANSKGPLAAEAAGTIPGTTPPKAAIAAVAAARASHRRRTGMSSTSTRRVAAPPSTVRVDDPAGRPQRRGPVGHRVLGAADHRTGSCVRTAPGDRTHQVLRGAPAGVVSAGSGLLGAHPPRGRGGGQPPAGALLLGERDEHSRLPA